MSSIVDRKESETMASYATKKIWNLEIYDGSVVHVI